MPDSDEFVEDELFELDLGPERTRLESIQRAHREAADQWLARMREQHRVPEHAQQTGPNQRLQMRVPTAGQADGTTISAGRRSDRSYDGYAVKTNRHLAMSGEGGVANSTMTLQANGQVIVQSDQASLFLVSTAPATLASTSVTNIAGAGVVIAAGGGAPVAMMPIKGEGPATPESVSGAASAAQGAAEAWSAWDDEVESETRARDDRRSAIDPARAAAYAAPKTAEGAKAVLVDANKAGEKSAGGAGGLVLHGEDNLLIGTPKKAALRAAEALTVSSKTIAQLAHEDAEIATGRDLNATVGRNASVLATGRMDMVASDETLHLASRKGPGVEVQGKALMFGETSPEDPQRATEHVFVRSTAHVSVTTDSDPQREERADGIHLTSHDVIEAKSDTSVTIDAVDSVTLRIGQSEIDIVVDRAGKISLRAKQAEIKIDDRAGITVSHRGTAVMSGSASRVAVGTGPSDKLEISSGSVALKGGTIKIG
jgi:hypothetical protein